MEKGKKTWRKLMGTSKRRKKGRKKGKKKGYCEQPIELVSEKWRYI
jgi:hypothetical protein